MTTMAMENVQERQALDLQGLLKEISGLATQYDIFRFLKKCTDLFGMRAFMVMRLPTATTQTLQAASVISSWPSEMLSRFDQSGLLQGSPAFARLRDTTVPFIIEYAVETTQEGSRDRAVAELFVHHRMKFFVFFPVSEPTGERGAVCFSGDRAAPEMQEMIELLMLSAHVYDRLHHVARKDVKAGEELTEREIDCLNWTAAGKTSAEISEILGLSEHTVNHYLNRATRKLDTVNRTQAVAKAIRTGVIT